MFTLALVLASSMLGHSVQEQPAEFVVVSFYPGDPWSVTLDLTPDAPEPELFVAVGDWSGSGPDAFAWLLSGGVGSGGTYAERLRACAQTGADACKPNPVCFTVYTESGANKNGTPVTTSCLVVCKDGSRPCPAPPTAAPAGGG